MARHRPPYPMVLVVLVVLVIPTPHAAEESATARRAGSGCASTLADALRLLHGDGDICGVTGRAIGCVHSYRVRSHRRA